MVVFLANQFKKYRFFYILYKKEGFLDQKKKFEKSPKNRVFPKGLVNPWFLSKNRTFYDLCFFGKSSQTRSFLDILDKKVSY